MYRYGKFQPYLEMHSEVGPASLGGLGGVLRFLSVTTHDALKKKTTVTKGFTAK